MNTTCFFRILVGAFGALFIGLSFASQKFDADLGRLRAIESTRANAPATVISAKSGLQGIETLVRFDGEALKQITAAGGIVRSVLGNIAVVEIPFAALDAVLELPSVKYVELAKRQVQRLNYSVAATRAGLLRSGAAPNWTGNIGQGVIVGVVDDGVAFRHLDFRKPNGETRILELWDQRQSGAAGSAPSGYGYGGVCTSAMMNAAIGGNASSCTQPSTGNHGTHVAGIAAGNGQQTGNGQPAYRFVGMAPGADILAANALNAGTPSSAVVDAVAWMKARAQAMGKPIVINLSLGSYFGPRDGTSNYEQALSNASGAGVIITGAAGNEGGDPIRAVGTVSQGETKSVTFSWPNSATKDQRLELWYPGTNQYAVKVTGPGVNCGTGTFILAGATQQFNLGCGTIEVTSTGVQSNNDDRQILVNLNVNNSNATPLQGTWTIELRGDTVSTTNTPFSIICGETGSGLVFTSNTESVTKGILTDSASATRVIAVAAYNTNYNWLTIGGVANAPPNHGPISDVSTFSSRGPRRDCSNLTKCPKVMKPDITAPGAMIMAALGNDAPVPTDGSVEQDGQHVAYNGTSMATPHVSGAIALMLAKNPRLTPEDVRRVLAQSRQTNAFTTSLPVFDANAPLLPATVNDAWGYGILDAKAAVDATPPGAARVNDFNGDSKSDVLWKNTDGSAYGWLMNGTTITSGAYLVNAGTGWSISHVADFNGDGKADVLWRHTDGSVAIWIMNGLGPTNTALLQGAGTSWSVSHVADLDGDGKADLLWKHTDGTVFAWLMNGTSFTSSSRLLGPGTGYSITHTADLNGDGKADILWKHTDGTVFAWLMNGTSFTSSSRLLGPGTGYSITHTADLDGDGKADILWKHTDGTVFAWLMNGTSFTSSSRLLGAGTGYSINHTADLDGDGKADLLWKHTDGTVYGWLMNGLSVSSPALLLGASTGYSITHTPDLNGDGKADILWRHTDGTVFAWLMNGLSQIGTQRLSGAGGGWAVSP